MLISFIDSYFLYVSQQMNLINPAPAWVANTSFNRFSSVSPTAVNGLRYFALTGGISGSVEPTWPLQLGDTIDDGTITWKCTSLMGSVVEARDWPLDPIQEGVPYLLVQQQLPAGGTKSFPEYACYCQWTWLMFGQDIAPNMIGQNRGDRYRRHMALTEYLIQAHYPGFCQKVNVASDQNTGALTLTPSVTVLPLPPNPYETIWWSEPRFGPRPEEKSGILYGTAAVTIYGFDSISALIA